jgi:beta-glucanase (GH16 family)
MVFYLNRKILFCIVSIMSVLTIAACGDDKGITTSGTDEQPTDTTDGNDKYELVWSEDFNYEGAPDPSKWNFEIGDSGWGNNEWQYYTDRLENARVGDGVLTITAREENYEGANYTSARMITYENGHYWQYGRVEARIKLPEGQGIWPAFWMLGKNIFEGTTWPATGEIDILEMIGGGENDSTLHGTAHWQEGGEHTYQGESLKHSEKLSQDFHVYAIEWDDEQIKWFFDGEQYYSLSIQSSSMSEFDAPFFILLNIAVGGDWPGYPDDTTQFPQTMEVDYVRVYQK